MSATTLEAGAWRSREAAHHARVDALVAGFLHRRAQAAAHPVEDFLFVYYPHSPARLRRWHPGPGVVLLPSDGALPQHAGWRWYLRTDGGVALDEAGYLARRGQAVRFVRDLLTATATRPPFLGCLGLHEWAMVYRAPARAVRHDGYPLRLGQRGTDEVVEAHEIRCSHADAYRFFTPEAAGRNALRPTRETQLDLEQPGCLHATMDLYKWAFKLAPAIPSDLTLECFDLAREARLVDMRASPYDLRELGVEPIPIETPAGKAAYVTAQRRIAGRGALLRAALLGVCERLLETQTHSAQAGEPAAGVLGPAELDVHEGTAQAQGRLTGSARLPDGDLATVPRQSPDRGDDRSSAAGEDLGDLP